MTIALCAHAESSQYCEFLLTSPEAKAAMPFRLETTPAEGEWLRTIVANGDLIEGLDEDAINLDVELKQAAHYMRMYLWAYQNARSPSFKVDLLRRVHYLAYVAELKLSSSTETIRNAAVRGWVKHVIPAWSDWDSFKKLQLQHMREQLLVDVTSASDGIRPKVASNYDFLLRYGGVRDLPMVELLIEKKSEPYAKHVFRDINAAINARAKKVEVDDSKAFEESPLYQDYKTYVDEGADAMVELIEDKIFYLQNSVLLGFAKFIEFDPEVVKRDHDLAISIAAFHGDEERWPSDLIDKLKEEVMWKLELYRAAKSENTPGLPKLRLDDLVFLQKFGRSNDLVALTALSGLTFLSPVMQEAIAETRATILECENDP